MNTSPRRVLFHLDSGRPLHAGLALRFRRIAQALRWDPGIQAHKLLLICLVSKRNWL